MLINIPSLLRIKPNVIEKTGKYLVENNFQKICLFWGEGLEEIFGRTIWASLNEYKIDVLQNKELATDNLKEIFDLYLQMPKDIDAFLVIGGGKAIDVGKYLAHISKHPLIAVPTAISNDGFCSSLSSLKVEGCKRTLQTCLPYGVLIDTNIISRAPNHFFYSGIGDLICKYTAIYDWKLAFHKTGLPVNDFAVSVAYTAADNFINFPNKDKSNLEFIRAFANSLMLSGIAMEIAGNSRPASGSEHLISHAYDQVSSTPSMHGLQVGVATYAIAWLQNSSFDKIKDSILQSGFCEFMSKNKLNKVDFAEAIKLAPTMKQNFYTILNEPNSIEKLLQFIEEDSLMNKMIE